MPVEHILKCIVLLFCLPLLGLRQLLCLVPCTLGGSAGKRVQRGRPSLFYVIQGGYLRQSGPPEQFSEYVLGSPLARVSLLLLLPLLLLSTVVEMRLRVRLMVACFGFLKVSALDWMNLRIFLPTIFPEFSRLPCPMRLPFGKQAGVRLAPSTPGARGLLGSIGFLIYQRVQLVVGADEVTFFDL